MNKKNSSHVLMLAVMTLLISLKITAAYFSIPRFYPVLWGNILLILSLWATCRLLRNKTPITWIPAALVHLMLFIEILFFFPYFYYLPFSASTVFFLSLLQSTFSVFYIVFAQRKHLSVISLTLSQIYLYLYFSKFQNIPILVYVCISLILLLLFLIFILFRIEIEKSRRISSLLKEQKLLNRQIAANQARLVAQEKYASLAMITAGLAHEINNPLNYIRGNFEFLKQNIKSLETGHYDPSIEEEVKRKNIIQDTAEILEDYEAGFDRMFEIVSGLRSIYGKQDSSNQHCDLNEIVKTVIKTHHSQAQKRIQIRSSIPEKIFLKQKQSSILSILANLVQNAVEAIGGEGEIIIAFKQDETKIMISVCDNGCGMTPDELSRIRDPYYTTKSGNMGIGLTLIISLLSEMNGTLEIKSQPEAGTVVRIFLPRVNNEE